MPAPVPDLADTARPAAAALQATEVVAPAFDAQAPAPAAPFLAGPAGPTTTESAKSAASEDPLASEDPAALDRLANQLYARVQSQLRSELLVSRERAQMLTDLG